MTTFINIEPLSTINFFVYGDVIEFRGRTRIKGRHEQYPDLAQIQTGGLPAISANLVHQAEAIELPFDLQSLEKHPVGGQLFAPLNHEPYLIVVALGGDKPDLSTIKCFRAERGQGIVYDQGIWHHPLLALKDQAEFLMINPGNVEGNSREYVLKPNAFRLMEHSLQKS